MMGLITNHKETQRQATYDDMETHEATTTRQISFNRLSKNLYN